MPEIHTYAVRRVNPFRGMVQVVATDTGRALSSDGLNWQLEVLAERPEHTWRSINQGPARKAYFRFGAWSEVQGLTCVPINPIMDIQGMIAAGEALRGAVAGHVADVPFPRTDHFERWLLDAEERPLALLATATSQAGLPGIDISSWSATADQDSLPDRAAVEAAVRAAGRARIAWYRQAPDAETLLFDDCGAPLAGKSEPANLPYMPLRTRWTAARQGLIDRYLDWLAPWLLCLPELDDSLRRRFEQAARKRPLEVAANFHLYPRIIDAPLLEAARVEARLRQSKSTTS